MLGFKVDNIVEWSVRRPGCANWSTHKEQAEAHAECRRANSVCQPGHVVYATHESGRVTGPYIEEGAEV